jgi:hypothetical protein
MEREVRVTDVGGQHITEGIDPKYKSLYLTLMSAFDQAATGKGKERHANDKSFESQPICQLTRDLGLAFPLGQASKKILESVNMRNTDFALKELKGAIVFLAAAIIVLEEKLKEGNDTFNTW